MARPHRSRDRGLAPGGAGHHQAPDVGTRLILAARYRDWVERYVLAWNSNDPEDIASLFADDARYLTEPHADPWVGRHEIVRRWLEGKDEPGDTTFTFDILVATDSLGIVRGETRYASTGRVYSNLWEIRLDETGTCVEFVEWWMEQRSG